MTTESNLDWKKVFKEILGPPSNKESVFPVECRDSSIVNNISSNDKVVKTEHGENNYKPKNNYCDKNSLLSRKESRKFLNTCYLDVKNTSTNLNKNDKVPEWNVVFKSILGSKPNLNVQDKKFHKHCSKEADDSLQKSDTSQKHMEKTKSRCYRQKMTPERKIKSKVDEEEQKVRDFFAQCRLFTLDYSYMNMSVNDYAGAGIDISRSGKVLQPSLSQEFELLLHENEFLLEDDNVYNPDSKVSVQSQPLKGLVANIKPLTREDILNTPCLSSTEAWDDDLLF